MKSLPKNNIKGFTLIELLVVIGILAILLSIVLIAINPARQFGQANNTKRRSAVTQILNAVGAYAADNKGTMTALGLLATPTEISNAGANICDFLVPNYIPALPTDPSLNTSDVSIDQTTQKCTTPYSTGYLISKDAKGRVTVTAQTTDNEEVITITR